MAHLLVRPSVGRMPTRLQCEAGPLTEFPVSVPKPTSAKLAATAAHRLHLQNCLMTRTPYQASGTGSERVLQEQL